VSCCAVTCLCCASLRRRCACSLIIFFVNRGGRKGRGIGRPVRPSHTHTRRACVGGWLQADRQTGRQTDKEALLTEMAFLVCILLGRRVVSPVDDVLRRRDGHVPVDHPTLHMAVTRFGASAIGEAHNRQTEETGEGLDPCQPTHARFNAHAGRTQVLFHPPHRWPPTSQLVT